MVLLDTFRVVVVIVYIVLFGILFPKSGTTYDLFKLRLNLFPYWVKFVSMIWIVLSLLIAIMVHKSFGEWKSVLFVSLNLSLFLLVFSKEKHEDELSEQLRFKSFTFSFITFLAFAGIYGATSVGRIHSVYILNYLFIQAMIGLSLMVSLTYFYYTKYKFLKENR
jgi:hypothetical protein